jgi:hypothetical protein
VWTSGQWSTRTASKHGGTITSCGRRLSSNGTESFVFVHRNSRVLQDHNPCYFREFGGRPVARKLARNQAVNDADHY